MKGGRHEGDVLILLSNESCSSISYHVEAVEGALADLSSVDDSKWRHEQLCVSGMIERS